MHRKTFVLGLGALAAGAGFGAQAQDWPSRSISLVVGFSPGGGSDVTARLFAQHLADVLGQPVVVENVVGAAGKIATEQVARTRPDGYRFVMFASTTFINNVIAARPTFNVLRDLAPVSSMTMSPLVLIVPAGSTLTVPEMLRQGKAQPEKFSFASDGVGGTAQLAGELIRSMAGATLLHVPFKGSAEAVVAVATGQTDMGFGSLTAVKPMIDGGKVRALAVTSAQRTALLPGVPTLSESGLPGYEVIGWFALMGPPGLPRPIVDRLNAALATVAERPEVKDALTRQGLERRLSSSEQLTAYMREQGTLIGRLAKEANWKSD